MRTAGRGGGAAGRGSGLLPPEMRCTILFFFERWVARERAAATTGAACRRVRPWTTTPDKHIHDLQRQKSARWRGVCGGAVHRTGLATRAACLDVFHTHDHSVIRPRSCRGPAGTVRDGSKPHLLPCFAPTLGERRSYPASTSCRCKVEANVDHCRHSPPRRLHCSRPRQSLPSTDSPVAPSQSTSAVRKQCA